MEQGSQEWLDWRMGGIGASESAQIMELSPYGSRLDLWFVKTKRKPAPDIGYKMERIGKDTEDLLRAKYSTHKDVNFQPREAFSDKYPFMLASLDAYDENTGDLAEMKFLGKEKYEAAGDDPDNINFMSEHHRIQCQHQMIVLDRPQMEYLISCDGGATYKYFVIKADKVMQKKILSACKKFWEYVTKDKQPPYGPNDYRPIKSPRVLKMIKIFLNVKAAGNKKELEIVKAMIRDNLKHPKMEALGVRISPSGFRFATQQSQDKGIEASPTASS